MTCLLQTAFDLKMPLASSRRRHPRESRSNRARIAIWELSLVLHRDTRLRTRGQSRKRLHETSQTNQSHDDRSGLLDRSSRVVPAQPKGDSRRSTQPARNDLTQGLATMREWLLFDHEAGWGTPEFEESLAEDSDGNASP